MVHHHLLQPKQILAGYEIEKFIGKGSMGEVYRARQLNLDRVVALKVLPPDTAQRDPDYARRFVGEAQSAGSLNHPNIIAVYNVGMAPLPHAAPGGPEIYFFVMEYVNGNSVRQIMEKKGRLPQAFIGRVMAGVTKALIYAESRGIVHRDIKPDNIMVTTDGVVKLADLGLALRRNGNEQTSQPSEQTDTKILGAPHYMSPEQARGQMVDARSDQYSLGATLYHLLTGQPPFGGNGANEIMRAHVSAPVPDPMAVNPEISPAWRQICMTLMAKQPADRYANSQELRAAVAEALHSPATTISHRVSSEPERTKRLRPRRRAAQRLPLVFFLGLSLVAIATVVLVTFLGSEGDTAKSPQLIQVSSQPTKPPNSAVAFDDVIEVQPPSSPSVNSSAFRDSPGENRPLGIKGEPAIMLTDIGGSKIMGAREQRRGDQVEFSYGTGIDNWIIRDFFGENMSLTNDGLMWSTAERFVRDGRGYKANELPKMQWKHSVNQPFNMITEFLIRPGTGSGYLSIGIYMDSGLHAHRTGLLLIGSKSQKPSAYSIAIESSISSSDGAARLVDRSRKSPKIDPRLVQKLEIKVGADLCPTYFLNNDLFYTEAKIPDGKYFICPMFIFLSEDKDEKSVTFKSLKILGTSERNKK